jgi:hypothetical protein
MPPSRQVAIGRKSRCRVSARLCRALRHRLGRRLEGAATNPTPSSTANCSRRAFLPTQERSSKPGDGGALQRTVSARSDCVRLCFPRAGTREGHTSRTCPRRARGSTRLVARSRVKRWQAGRLIHSRDAGSDLAGLRRGTSQCLSRLRPRRLREARAERGVSRERGSMPARERSAGCVREPALPSRRDSALFHVYTPALTRARQADRAISRWRFRRAAG